jgi:hypothetical protein
VALGQGGRLPDELGVALVRLVEHFALEPELLISATHRLAVLGDGAFDDLDPADRRGRVLVALEDAAPEVVEADPLNLGEERVVAGHEGNEGRVGLLGGVEDDPDVEVLSEAGDGQDLQAADALRLQPPGSPALLRTIPRLRLEDRLSRAPPLGQDDDLVEVHGACPAVITAQATARPAPDQGQPEDRGPAVLEDKHWPPVVDGENEGRLRRGRQQSRDEPANKRQQRLEVVVGEQ